MDLADLQAKKDPVTRAQLQARVRALLQTRRAKEVAANTFKSFRKTCVEVDRKEGAASNG